MASPSSKIWPSPSMIFNGFIKYSSSSVSFASRRLVKSEPIIPVSTEALRDTRREESAGCLSRPLSVAAPLKFYPPEPGRDQALWDQQIGYFYSYIGLRSRNASHPR